MALTQVSIRVWFRSGFRTLHFLLKVSLHRPTTNFKVVAIIVFILSNLWEKSFNTIIHNFVFKFYFINKYTITLFKRILRCIYYFCMKSNLYCYYLCQSVLLVYLSLFCDSLSWFFTNFEIIKCIIYNMK